MTIMNNKVVVITGASSGIGREVARLMADQGHRVYDLSRSDKPQDGVRHLRCDVTDRATIQTAVDTIKSEVGRIDTLILCAGSGVAGALEFMTEEELQFQFDVNAFGPLRVVQAALPLMREQMLLNGKERGRIVFISSMAAVFPLPYQGLYSATKMSVNAIAYALRNELHPLGIGVTSILPGDVKTGFTAARRKNETGKEIYTHMDGAFEAMTSDEVNGSKPEVIAKRIVKIVNRKNVGMYYTLDSLSLLEYILQRIAPHKVALWVVRKMYRC